VNDSQSECAQRRGGGGEEQEIPGRAPDRLARILVHQILPGVGIGGGRGEQGRDVGRDPALRVDGPLVARDPRDEVAQRRPGVTPAPQGERLIGAEVGVRRGGESGAALEIGAEQSELGIDGRLVAALVGLVGRPSLLADAQRDALGGDDDLDLAGERLGREPRRDGVSNGAFVAIPRHRLVRPGGEGRVGQRDREVDDVPRRNPARRAVVQADGP